MANGTVQGGLYKKQAGGTSILVMLTCASATALAVRSMRQVVGALQ